jgi:hypothetical protein
MKNIIISFFSLAFVALLFTSCDVSDDDFMTGDAQTGGLISPTKTFPYKLGGTTTFDLSIGIPKGPGIVSIEVYKTYTGKAEVLDRTIDVASANAAGPITKTITYDYEALISGLSMPADESELEIGDAWTLKYVSVMEDGRKVISGVQTNIGVANFFAGSYAVNVTYHHPSYGTYPNDIYVNAVYDKDLLAINANTCTTYMSTWPDYPMNITINDDNSLTVEWVDRTDVSLGDPYDATKVSHYDRETGVIYLYYNYSGAGGFRIFWEVFTLK